MHKVGRKPKKNPVGRPKLEKGQGGYRKNAGRKRKVDKKEQVTLYYKKSVIIKNFAPTIEIPQNASKKQLKEAIAKMKEYFYGIFPSEI